MTPPPFAEWLADPNAKPVKLTCTGDTLDWIAQAYGDEGVNEILTTIEESRGSKPQGGYVITFFKDEAIEGQWHYNPSYGFNSQGDYYQTRIAFKSTAIYLEDI